MPRNRAAPADRPPQVRIRDARDRGCGGITFSFIGVPAGLVSARCWRWRARLRRAAHQGAAVAGARVLRADRHAARRRGDAGNPGRHHDLAAQRRAPHGVDHLHHGGDDLLPAACPWLGSALGAARRQPRRDGPGGGAGGGVRRRHARRRHRADHAGAGGHDRIAGRARAVRLRGGRHHRGAGSGSGLLARRSWR